MLKKKKKRVLLLWQKSGKKGHTWKNTKVLSVCMCVCVCVCVRACMRDRERLQLWFLLGRKLGMSNHVFPS